MTIFDEAFPEFNLGGVNLRALDDSDAQSYYDYMNQPEMHAFLALDTMPSSYQGAISDMRYWGSLFSRRRSIYWGIATADTNALIGTVGFNSWNERHNRADISYDLAPAFWGHGIMFCCLQQVLDFAYKHMGLVRVQATVLVTNKRSVKLLERCGFALEGTLKKYEIVSGQHSDYYMYGRVR